MYGTRRNAEKTVEKPKRKKLVQKLGLILKLTIKERQCVKAFTKFISPRIKCRGEYIHESLSSVRSREFCYQFSYCQICKLI